MPWHSAGKTSSDADLVFLCGAVETVLEGHDVDMVHHLHDLQLPVLEALILQDLLYRHLHNNGTCHIACKGHQAIWVILEPVPQ